MDVTELPITAIRREVDPIARDTVLRLRQSQHSADGAGALQQLALAPLQDNAVYRDYIERYQQLPDWVDYRRLAEAAEIFGLYGPQILVALLCHSLPLCYSCARGAKVLAATGRLTQQSASLQQEYTNRIMTTAQFVMNVMAPDAIINGEAVERILHVRLVHEFVRQHLEQQHWDYDAYDAPINQLDSLGTLMTFSVVPLHSLQKMGVALSQSQRESVVHVWAVVGYFLGIKTDYLPQTVSESERLLSYILTVEGGPSADGVALSSALLAFIDDVLLIEDSNCFGSFMIRYMVGKDTADMLEIPPENSFILMMFVPIMRGLMYWYERFLKRHSWAHKYVEAWSRQFLQRFVNHYNKHKRDPFKMSPRLRANWYID